MIIGPPHSEKSSASFYTLSCTAVVHHHRTLKKKLIFSPRHDANTEMSQTESTLSSSQSNNAVDEQQPGAKAAENDHAAGQLNNATGTCNFWDKQIE